MEIDISKVPAELLFESAHNMILDTVKKAQKVYAVPPSLLTGYLYEAIAQVQRDSLKAQAGAYGKLIDAVGKQKEEKQEDET